MSMDDVKLSDIIQDLNQKVDAVYRHGTLQERYSAIARDYGEGFVLTESEAHTLGYVCEMGEEKFQREGNRKCIYVQPTERGKRANDIHRAYDRAATSVMLADLLKTCTIEEVESFFKVTQARIKYLSKEQASSEQ